METIKIKIKKTDLFRLKRDGFTKKPFVFEAAEGGKYVITHGIKCGKHTTFLKTGKKLAFSTKSLVKYLIKEGMISANDNINLICCYGAGVKNNTDVVNVVTNTTKKVIWHWVDNVLDTIFPMFSNSDTTEYLTITEK